MDHLSQHVAACSEQVGEASAVVPLVEKVVVVEVVDVWQVVALVECVLFVSAVCALTSCSMAFAH